MPNFSLYLKSPVRLKVEGLNLDRLINKLITEGYTLYNFVRTGSKSIEFELGYSDYKKLQKLSADFSGSITVLSSKGLKNLLNSARLRLGLVIGVILLIGLIGVYNSFIWNVEITGAVNTDIEAVKALLHDSGIKRYGIKKNIDTNSVKTLVSTSFDSVSFCNITVIGTVVKVEIIETVQPIEPEPEGTSLDIYAREDCRISSMIVLSGTPLVKIGDVVKKGQMIVAGYKTVMVEDKETTVEVKAVADVFAEVWYNGSNIFLPERVEYTRTGEYIDSKSMKSFGHEWEIDSQNNPFTFYESETFSEYAFKNTLLPIKIITHRVYELKAVNVTLNYEDYKSGVEQEALNDALVKVPFEAKISDKYFYTTVTEGFVRVEAVVLTEQKISYRI